MNVYVCKFKGGYCGGLAVVAAGSEDEAYDLVRRDERCGGFFPDFDEYGERITDDETEPAVCYHRRDFQLLPNVTADVTEPQILAEDHYEE